ncbi:MAG: Gfo/Idh/MocA family oxidoreductase [Planctomycetota bacterium]|jgi:UDP-N-acetyl-2-amino-2-deoxyglucuronate dehydrogenase|nr:Gfo/Idh/MocA family oxidoreductase [Planctomycetota bacterium]
MEAAIIGCGVIARTHKGAIDADGRPNLRWTCDPDITAAKAVAPDARHAYDLAEVLLDDAVDVVHICTPHAVHKGQLLAALAAGKHVICEKPLATTPADLRAMTAAAAAAQSRGQVAACIFQHRHGGLVRRLKEMLDSGVFGQLTSAKLPFRCTRKQSYYDSGAWRGTWHTEGGGVCINQAIHSIDLLVWLCGNDPVSVQASCSNKRLREVIEVEDEAFATIGFNSGLSAELDITNNQVDGWVTSCDIVGERGSISVSQNGGGTIHAIQHDDQSVVDELRAIEAAIKAEDQSALPGKACYGNLHNAQISDCYDAISEGRQPFVTIADGAVAAEVVLGIYHATATGGRASLPLPDAYQVPNLLASSAASA